MIESVLQVFDEELAEKRLTFKESDDIVKQKQLVGRVGHLRARSFPTRQQCCQV